MPEDAVATNTRPCIEMVKIGRQLGKHLQIFDVLVVGLVQPAATTFDNGPEFLDGLPDLFPAAFGNRFDGPVRQRQIRRKRLADDEGCRYHEHVIHST